MALLRSGNVGTSLAFVALGLACLAVADISVTTLHPWQELGRLGLGFLTPAFHDPALLAKALMHTVAFALLGVAIASVAGMGLALVYHWRLVRVATAFVRAIHELFWALLFLQILGLHPLTGLLAITIPYAGIFAKVYAEILEEADRSAEAALPGGAGLLSRFVYTRVPDAWAHIRSYTLYRVECGLRTSAVLGFVGLPTLGFYLDSAFMQGVYSQVGALLILFYVLIAAIRYWLRPRMIPVYLAAAPFLLGGGLEMHWTNVARFFTQDIVPPGLHEGDAIGELGGWAASLISEQILPGAASTLILTQIALVATGILTLLLFPVVSRHFTGPLARKAGHLGLVVARSTPEYILAYMFLQLWGPSMLPAIVALALHNAAIIAHLIGRYTDEITLRPDAPRPRLIRYGYEILPRVYNQFLAFLFYRWEVILRETAILGILGIHTLGFYVDSAIQDIRLDRMLALLLATALLNIAVDSASRRIRARLRLRTTPSEGTPPGPAAGRA